MLYSILLPLHSILRWILVIASLAAVGRAFYGWLGKKPWLKLDNQLGMAFTMAMDMQVLVGLILYFFASPLVQLFFKNMGGAMGNPQVRYFGVEHIFIMILALGISHAGRTLSRRATDPVKKHRAAALLFGLSLLVVLAAIPWPFSAMARPWIRFW